MSEIKITQIENAGNVPVYLGFPGENWQMLEKGAHSVSIQIPQEGNAKILRMTTNKEVYPWQEFYFYQDQVFNTNTNETVHIVSKAEVGGCSIINHESTKPGTSLSISVESDINGRVTMSNQLVVS